jgi:hypothetical protein
MYQSEQINELATALAKAQSKIRPAIKDNNNPFFKSKYADFSSIWNACVEPLGEQGLSIMQIITSDNGKPCLVTQLTHSSGQWIRSTAPLNPKKDDDQAMGSSISYMKRYSLAALVGVVTEEEDDDGNASVGITAQKEKNVVSKEQKEIITPHQLKNLHHLIFQIGDPDFVQRVLNYYLKEGITSWEKLTQDKYEAVCRSFEGKIKSRKNEMAGVA